jgi:hypothetical protein
MKQADFNLAAVAVPAVFLGMPSADGAPGCPSVFPVRMAGIHLLTRWALLGDREAVDDGELTDVIARPAGLCQLTYPSLGRRDAIDGTHESDLDASLKSASLLGRCPVPGGFQSTSRTGGFRPPTRVRRPGMLCSRGVAPLGLTSLTKLLSDPRPDFRSGGLNSCRHLEAQGWVPESLVEAPCSFFTAEATEGHRGGGGPDGLEAHGSSSLCGELRL